jgi:hypothetical protein
MAKIRIVGDSSGYVEIAALNAAGNNTLELPSGSTKLVGSDNSGNIVVGVVTATSISGVSTAGITTAYIGSVNDGPISGARNRIINGDMRVDQRNAGASVSISGGTASYAADRFNLYVNTGTFALQRVSDAPTGFLYSDKVTVSSAGSSSSGVTNAVHFEQKIEGYNIDDLGVGTSNAKVVTLSFWVKSSVTGTYSLHFGNDTDRFYVTTYSISSANTWEYKTKTITLATSGTWNTTNGRGLEIVWSLLGGSTYQTSSTDQWISTEKFHVTGSVQFGENAAATWQITGVQLEVGTVATPFERRSYGQELSLCQRYYEKSFEDTVAPANGSSTTSFITESGLTWGWAGHRSLYPAGGYPGRSVFARFKVPKRVAPSVAIFGNSNGYPYIYDTTNGGRWVTVNWGTSANKEGFEMSNEFASGAMQFAFSHWAASAEL